ncbi:cupin domain-containing protein [Streptomyces pinistramenti]|uniref:cupin domain-containing protein n=1 Tax=Streptomyces pinistramenti TaxID=2884812 RepID=UPI001D087707|nr:cupin domain-containing protein [Streptomyces pinistramenti]MCB5908053.1 cupin domain-containing protein [Streptomyces pinistramenti]
MVERDEAKNPKLGGIQVIRGWDMSPDSDESPEVQRMGGIYQKSAGAQNIWLGKVYTPPGVATSVHHHGVAETAGYVLQGQARMHYGDNLEYHLDMEEGDFVYVPPQLVHVEANRSETSGLIVLVSRVPDNIVVDVDSPKFTKGAN